ncbi:hypothetical protein FAES_4891 [Fibrella aestuarina BUZ 2]|uniref:Uncharacterized protein n=1 Tax=Fibrella aestuarina BUZ 2 TaxID=1166018 RepID=I0KFI7_9BACT|nr:hypothetical protein [Fibrella aestuarina]CCH02890.1 hypothetical protein FAES_4891 [Fibrella aestuarina BUZ 2]
MIKLTFSALCFLSVASSAFAQVHRDGGGNESTGIDFLSLGIGVVVGLVIGYLLGSRRKAA